MTPPRRNRVDPWGDLHAAGGRGLFTGNRGCLMDAGRRLARHHAGDLWITCMLSLPGRRRRQPLDAPRRWTPLFFLDDAVALAAGHRPCAYCRRADYLAYRDALTIGLDLPRPITAQAINRRLAAERLAPGRGIERARDRKLWSAPAHELPEGTVVLDAAGEPRLLHGARAWRFTFEGWAEPSPRADITAEVPVLTPRTSVLALAYGFSPTVHPSAGITGQVVRGAIRIASTTSAWRGQQRMVRSSLPSVQVRPSAATPTSTTSHRDGPPA